jgi:hypothetical protein
MAYATVGPCLVAAGMLALAGCARDNVPHPAYLGLSDLLDGESTAAAQIADRNNEPDALRHIQSNKVLGAMAFQTVTGQAVDPDSLLGHNGNE